MSGKLVPIEKKIYVVHVGGRVYIGDGYSIVAEASRVAKQGQTLDYALKCHAARDQSVKIIEALHACMHYCGDTSRYWYVRNKDENHGWMTGNKPSVIDKFLSKVVPRWAEQDRKYDEAMEENYRHYLTALACPCSVHK